MQNNESMDIQSSVLTMQNEADSLEKRMDNIKEQRKKFRAQLDSQKEMALKEQEAIRQILMIAQQESISVQLEKNSATREREAIKQAKNLEGFKLAEEKERMIKQKEEAIWQNMKDLGERMGKLANKVLNIDDKIREIEDKVSDKLKPLETALDKKHFEIEMKQQEINRLNKGKTPSL